MTPPYRVIQWATGSVGRESLRAVLAHPDLELAGVRVYSADKEGCDAGELCGAAATGVRATQDTAALLATHADCVLYMPRTADLDEVCAILASGKNVVATPFLFYGHAYPEAERAKLERACAQGKSSVHGTGFIGGDFDFHGRGQAIRQLPGMVRPSAHHRGAGNAVTLVQAEQGAAEDRGIADMVASIGANDHH